MLNRSKGPAVWGPRAQIDRKLYKNHMQALLKDYPNLAIRAGSVHDITFQDESTLQSGRRNLIDEGDASTSTMQRPAVAGVRLESGEVISCSQVVICTGTFLAGEIHIGTLSR